MSLAVCGHIMRGAHNLHNQGIVHRDLKPSNTILLPSTNTFSLIDFGSAAPLGQVVSMSISVKYAAPEVAAAYVAGDKTIEASPAVVCCCSSMSVSFKPGWNWDT